MEKEKQNPKDVEAIRRTEELQNSVKKILEGIEVNLEEDKNVPPEVRNALMSSNRDLEVIELETLIKEAKNYGELKAIAEVIVDHIEAMKGDVVDVEGVGGDTSNEADEPLEVRTDAWLARRDREVTELAKSMEKAKNDEDLRWSIAEAIVNYIYLEARKRRVQEAQSSSWIT